MWGHNFFLLLFLYCSSHVGGAFYLIFRRSFGVDCSLTQLFVVCVLFLLQKVNLSGFFFSFFLIGASDFSQTTQSPSEPNPTGISMTDKPGLSPGSSDDAGSIMALLERVAGLMDGVQNAQQRMEERQLELENTVKTIQADVVKLTSEHANTSSTVERLLEKTRKVSRHIKDVRVRVETQNIRVKKVEATQGDLLAKNKFRVVIYQVKLI